MRQNNMKIFVKAKPRAKISYVKRVNDGLFANPGEVWFVVAVKEPPVDGRANRAIEKAIAEYFHVPRACVSVISGHTTRNKVLEIVDRPST